jgi:hypothetical protein
MKIIVGRVARLKKFNAHIIKFKDEKALKENNQ